MLIYVNQAFFFMAKGFYILYLDILQLTKCTYSIERTDRIGREK